MKKAIVISLYLCVAALTAAAQQGELIIIGDVHQAAPNYNADTLLRIFEKLQPDIILLEVDSAHFTSDSTFANPSAENEQTATTRYLLTHPGVKTGPFEYEGRNEYRLRTGIKQSDEPATQLLDSLYTTGQLSKAQAGMVKEYRRLTDTLSSYGNRTAYHFNNAHTDSISRLRQWYQHHQLRSIIDARPEFANLYVTTTGGERISLREGYDRQCEFWDLRNQTMAKNISRVIDLNPNKRIIVMTGFFHRY